jgi:hypothetical protein
MGNTEYPLAFSSVWYGSGPKFEKSFFRLAFDNQCLYHIHAIINHQNHPLYDHSLLPIMRLRALEKGFIHYFFLLHSTIDKDLNRQGVL